MKVANLKVWEALEQVKPTGTDKEHGICHNLVGVSHEHSTLPVRATFFSMCVDAYKDWPKYSGNEDFPVPHNTHDCADAYYECINLWDRRTQYGKDRYELLNHLIQWYKERDL